ncbi:aminotransferase class V-fold PLP-dependent enzyme [Agromyces sp. LHK192]|uniref:pyridoxal phosphate-dependent decarboxylase family protein n=1 Tax=Agromyces sp. LHK192 TaxID=2498704 RepID=UPI000FD73C61|nr:aminotransferase class V-fold PLP-dependent enzyme [Agromyces sp. LHK192]
MTAFRREPAEVLAELRSLREADAPTHGGHVLSYVYDSGIAELDELAADAARLVQPVNGLDPTTFTSVAAMESRVLGFARDVFHGDDDVVGSVTSGGTESCLMAVKGARDAWRAARTGSPRTPRLVAPVTAHAAFQKAAAYLGLELDLVPVDPATGAVSPAAIEERLGDDVALVVVSAPSYPFATMDPVFDVAAICAPRGIRLHVDACIGGFALAFRESEGDLLRPWDFRVPGITSLSADLHKYGFAPKGVSVLLTRGRDLHRRQYFATTRWPGYPVVNPTMTGSKPAGPLAAAWAIIEALGVDGFRDLSAQSARATVALREAIDGIEGLRVVGEPTGPLLAVATDDTVEPERRVDPHHWADAARGHGWILQLQPGLAQDGGEPLPRTTHLTVTPVTERVLGDLVPALRGAADEVRGVPPIDGEQALAGLAQVPGAAAVLGSGAPIDSDTAAALLRAIGLGDAADGTGGTGGGGSGGSLPAQMAPVLALVEALPAPLTERLLVELLARVVEPRS